MNITPGYGHQVEVTNKTQNLHESEADKEGFKETEDLMKNDNEGFVSF